MPPETVKKGEEEKEAGGAGSGWDGVGEEEEGGMAGLNSKCDHQGSQIFSDVNDELIRQCTSPHCGRS